MATVPFSVPGSPIAPGSYVGGFTITPSDTVDLPRITRAIYVGGSGNIAVIMNDGTTFTFTGLVVGAEPYEFSVSRVKSTGTTATNLIGLY